MVLRRSLVLSLSLHALAFAGAAWMVVGPAIGPRGPLQRVPIAFLEPDASPRLQPRREPETLQEPDSPIPVDAALRPAEVPFEEVVVSPEADPPLHEPMADGRLLARMGNAPLARPVPPPQTTPHGAAAASAPPPSAPPSPAEAAYAAAILLEAPPPAYPRLSLRLGEQGSVRLELEIGTDGRVLSATVLEGSGHGRLDKAARDAVLAWRFSPAQRGGIAVPARIVHLVTFRITDAS